MSVVKGSIQNAEWARLAKDLSRLLTEANLAAAILDRNGCVVAPNMPERPAPVGVKERKNREDDRIFITRWSAGAIPQARESRTAGLFDVVTPSSTDRPVAEKEESYKGAELQLSQAQFRKITAGLFKAQEEERRRLARELHDDLNQRLAILAIQVEKLEQDIPRQQDSIRRRLVFLRRRIEAISADVQRTAHQLHPSVLEHLGLVAALESLCADFRSQNALEVMYRVRDVPDRLDPSAALCLYRITQEALTNVVKHSGQREAGVTLTGSRKQLRLIVEDRGSGFDPYTVKKGLGLMNMTERARLTGGKLSISLLPGRGTRVEAVIPMNTSIEEP